MKEPSIPLAIDNRVWSEVGSFFPLDGNHQTAASNAECRRIVVLLIWTALKDSNCCFSFSQRVMDCMSLVGSKKRKRVVEYFSQSQYFEVAQNYSAGRNSIIWKLSKAKVKRVSGSQHSECDVDDYAYLRPRWQYAGVVVTENLPVEWLQAYDQSFNRACSLLWPEQSRWSTLLGHSTFFTVTRKPMSLDRLSSKLFGSTSSRRGYAGRRRTSVLDVSSEYSSGP